jgi:hypothetical protein
MTNNHIASAMRNFQTPPALIPVALISVATILRIWIAAASVGSSDVAAWYQFAVAIDEDGLWRLYARDSLCNVPPLGVLLVWATYKIHLATGIAFPFILRIPGILGDVLTLTLIGFRCRLRSRLVGICLFGFAPVPLLIAGYHGNLDSLVNSMAFASAVVLHSGGSVFRAGLILGIAASIKLPPLVFVPVALFVVGWSRWWVFLLGVVIPLISVVGGVIWGGWPFIQDVLQYQPPLDMWGITVFLTTILGPWRSEISGFPHIIATLYALPAKLLILALPVFVMNTLRSTDILFGFLLAFGGFLIFAPGFGPQYLVYPLPALVLLAPRWAARYLAAGSCALIALYSWFFVGYPFASNHNSTAPLHVSFLYYLTWCAITGGVGATIGERWTRRGDKVS